MVQAPVSGRRISRRTTRNIVVGGVVFLAVVAVLAGGWFLYGSMEKAGGQQANEALEQKAKQIAAELGNIISVIPEQLKSLSKEAAIITLFQSADKDSLGGEAQNRLSEFEAGLKLRFFLPGEYQRDSAAVPPLGFRSIKLLEQAEQNDSPISMEVHFYDSPQQHIVAIEPVLNRAGELIGLMHLSLDTNIAEQLLAGVKTTDAYIEVQQTGVGKKLVLARAGVKPPQQAVKVTKAINGTRWRVAYWQAGGTAGSSDEGGFLLPAIITTALFMLAGGIGFYFMGGRPKANPDERTPSPTVYGGAVLAIMEGAHPGMEKRVPGLPTLAAGAPIKTTFPERAVGDDVTRIGRRDDVQTGPADKPAGDLGKS